jgi:cytochrome c-type biogenesis protein CcmE
MPQALMKFATVLAAVISTSMPVLLFAGDMMAIPDLIAHAEQYDRQMVTVTGRVSDLQIATNRDGQLAYGFLLKDPNGTLKVIGLGKAEVREGDQVIVEGIFSRLRQVGRAVIYNEIKATVVRPMDRLNPDLVG